jgi:lipoprotein-anchoring transpeptidase ErfK/SrfK
MVAATRHPSRPQRRLRSRGARAGLVLALALGVAVPVAGAKSGPAKPSKGTAAVKHEAAPKVNFPRHFGLTNATVARWAGVMRPAVVRTDPRDDARVVTELETWTSDNTQNVVLVLGGVELKGDQTWYRVRLPILPNNTTGWVRKSVLSDLYTVDTHLYIHLGKLRATLKKDGKVVFSTHVGLGTSSNPTPRGHFYVRSKLVGYDSPVYGPLAFGTSARSPTLTDWPGGGFVGVHGTNQPEILPGYVSHGCIRMPNEAILRLSRLMPVGTPITIH